VPPQSSDAQALASAPAVRLFLARARSARADAGVAPVAVVARICRELDGLPLAIELAAARASVLSAEEIAAHLADKFRFLAYRRQVADPRHQALTAAIGWSYDLLSAEQCRVLRGLSVFAGGFGLAAVAAVCCGGDEAAALDLVDQLAGKSLVVAEPAAGGTRYRLLETIRQYAAERLAEAGEAEQARRRHAEAFLRLAEEERGLPVLLREQDNFRAALGHTLAGGSPIGPRLARVLGGFWLARGLFQEARGWLEGALAAGPADPRLRADLLRLLGAVLYAAGDLERAQAILAQGAEVAAAAGLPSTQARIGVLLAEIHAAQSGTYAEAIEACETAAPLLESEGDLEGLAEAWLMIGRTRFWDYDPLGAEEALERAADCARRSGNHRAELASTATLVSTFRDLPITADSAIARAEQLLEAATGDPWAEAAILRPLSLLPGYAGRFADARAAYTRSQAILTRAGANFDWAMCAALAGEIELIVGEPAAAEQILRQGDEALRAMGERAHRATTVAMRAEAAYAQGHFGQAQRLTEEAEALAGADDVDAQARWRATRAKLLAQRGQFPAAARLADEAVALIPATADAPERAEFLVAKAEVSQLAGAPGDAEASLRRALQFYEDRRMVALAERTRALLASLAAQRHTPAEQ
jgi:tetratricopeptide (TPR) repeat protein